MWIEFCTVSHASKTSLAPLTVKFINSYSEAYQTLVHRCQLLQQIFQTSWRPNVWLSFPALNLPLFLAVGESL